MTSSKPYLVRALYEWIADNSMTPFVVVDALRPDVIVPQKHIEDGRIVLNIAAEATHNLRIGNDALECDTKFSGISFHINVPITAVLAIYAQESNQGLTFPPEDLFDPMLQEDDFLAEDEETETNADNIIQFPKPKK